MVNFSDATAGYVRGRRIKSYNTQLVTGRKDDWSKCIKRDSGEGEFTDTYIRAK